MPVSLAERVSRNRQFFQQGPRECGQGRLPAHRRSKSAFGSRLAFLVLSRTR